MKQIIKTMLKKAGLELKRIDRSGYGEKLRSFLTTNTTIHTLIDFGDAPVFEEAIAYPSIIILSKENQNSDTTINVLTWETDKPFNEFISIITQNNFVMQQKDLLSDGWRLESSAVLRLLDKLRNAGTPLGDYVKGRFYYGIKTGFNEAFVIDRETRDRLIAEHPSSEEVLKPFLRGRDVKRWVVNFAEQYLIKIESSENKKHPWSDQPNTEAENIFSQTYPAIYQWLNQYREQLIKRYDQGKYFWELRSCKYWNEFESDKIMYPNICKQNEFTWDENNYYINQKAFIIPSKSKYLLGIFNSSVVMWIFTQLLAKLQNDFYEPSGIFMKQFPIPKPTDTQDACVTQIVNKILEIKSNNPNADVSELERDIDQLVYELYGLNEEEIAIIENQS